MSLTHTHDTTRARTPHTWYANHDAYQMRDARTFRQARTRRTRPLTLSHMRRSTMREMHRRPLNRTTVMSPPSPRALRHCCMRPQHHWLIMPSAPAPQDLLSLASAIVSEGRRSSPGPRLKFSPHPASELDKNRIRGSHLLSSHAVHGAHAHLLSHLLIASFERSKRLQMGAAT